MSKSAEPIVSPSQVVAAGAASAGAAGVTSSIGVAGTLIGAAITTMIITGGSAILKAYLENATGTIKNAPGKLRATANRRKAGRLPEEPRTLPDNPGLRNNFMGRLRASFSWFSRLPSSRRRPILIKAGIAALVAFVIAMAAVTLAEKGIGNSFSCGFWGSCPEGAAPGIHLGETRGTGANSTAGLGGASTAAPDSGVESPSLSGGEEEQVPAEDPAAQDPPVEDPAAEPAPVEEAPVEDPAAEPAPVEEAPPE
ncbi:MAG: hypothetical protein ACR2G1_08765 [Rubrobacteraceae bacterium]